MTSWVSRWRGSRSPRPPNSGSAARPRWTGRCGPRTSWSSTPEPPQVPRCGRHPAQGLRGRACRVSVLHGRGVGEVVGAILLQAFGGTGADTTADVDLVDGHAVDTRRPQVV